MMRGGVGLAAAALLISWRGPDRGDLSGAFQIHAGDIPVDVEWGHAAPCFTDIDADGLSDLLVGQFRNGSLRIYRNAGEPGKPHFTGFTMFETEEGEGSVPAA